MTNDAIPEVFIPELPDSPGGQSCEDPSPIFVLELPRSGPTLIEQMLSDKMPNDSPNIGLLHLILPNGHIIDARRHPVDSRLGRYWQFYAKGQYASYDLTETAHPVRTESSGQIRRPICSESLNFWKRHAGRLAEVPEPVRERCRHMEILS